MTDIERWRADHRHGPRQRRRLPPTARTMIWPSRLTCRSDLAHPDHTIPQKTKGETVKPAPFTYTQARSLEHAIGFGAPRRRARAVSPAGQI